MTIIIQMKGMRALVGHEIDEIARKSMDEPGMSSTKWRRLAGCLRWKEI